MKEEKRKLAPEHKYILNLIARDAKPDGWVTVSDALYHHLSETMPKALVIFGGVAGHYKAKLTDEGMNIITAMEWL